MIFGGATSNRYSMIKVLILSGVSILLVMIVFVFASIAFGHDSVVARFAYWTAPFCGAFMASYKSPTDKFNIGFCTIIIASIALGCANYTLGQFDSQTDLSGFRGSIIVGVFSIPRFILPCFVGALLASLVSNKRNM